MRAAKALVQPQTQVPSSVGECSEYVFTSSLSHYSYSKVIIGATPVGVLIAYTLLVAEIKVVLVDVQSTKLEEARYSVELCPL